MLTLLICLFGILVLGFLVINNIILLQGAYYLLALLFNPVTIIMAVLIFSMNK